MGEMLERRSEERGREWSQAGQGVPPSVPTPPLQQGPLDRNNKKRSTSLARPWLFDCLVASGGPQGPAAPPLGMDAAFLPPQACHPCCSQKLPALLCVYVA